MPDFQGGYFTIFLVCLIISSILISKLYKSSHVKSHLPPSPFRLPVIGHLHLLGRIPHHAFQKLSNRHGPIFRLFLGSTPYLVVTSPELGKEIFKTHENAFLDRPQYSIANYLSYGQKGLVLAPYGSYWRFLKKTMMSELLNGKTLDLLYPVRRDEVNHFIKYLSQKAKDSKYVELEVELMKIENNVISRMFMSKRCSEDNELPEIIAKSAVVVGRFNISDHIWFCKNLDLQGLGKLSKDIYRRYDTFMERIIGEHERSRKQDKGKGKDMLSILLEISEDESMERKLTKEDIKSLFKDVLNAGTDTSALTLEWALAELINHPNIMKKAVDEIDQVVGKNRLIQESDLPNLPYLQTIIKETLRLHPPVPVIQRLQTQDCTVGGYHIPANTNTLISVWSMNRDPNHWENPLEFKPERFEGINDELDVRGQHYQFLPFGGGRRLCPGISLALLLTPTILGAMIQCFEWKTRDNNGPVDMEEGIGVTLARANPLVCAPVARLHPIPLFV